MKSEYQVLVELRDLLFPHKKANRLVKNWDHLYEDKNGNRVGTAYEADRYCLVGGMIKNCLVGGMIKNGHRETRIDQIFINNGYLYWFNGGSYERWSEKWSPRKTKTILNKLIASLEK